MSGEERRKEILNILTSSNEPVSGSFLAKKLSVSRQVIVQDMALLRASDKNILSTYRGYMIFSNFDKTCKRCIQVRHSDSLIRKEMEIIVKNGGKMLDITVEHEIYGQISVDLIIRTYNDIDVFLSKKPESKTLLSLTDGVHFHTIEADSEEILDKIEKELKILEEEK